MALFVQSLTDSRHPAVHHVGGSHDISPGFGLAHRHLLQMLQSSIIIHIMAAKLPAMAVAGILAKAHIADDYQFRHLLLDSHDSPLHRALHIPGGRANLVLVLGNAEDLHRRNPQGSHQFGLLYCLVHRQMIAAGHGGNLLPYIGARHKKQRIDEVLHGKRRLPHHGAEILGNAHAARPQYLIEHSMASKSLPLEGKVAVRRTDG